MKFILSLLLLLGASWWFGLFDYFSDLSRLQNDIKILGILGPILYVLIFFVAYLVGLHPGLVWVSGNIWPVPLAILYSNLAGLISGFIVFWLARRFGQEWIHSKLPSRIKRYEKKLENNPAKTLVILRMLMWINVFADLFFGVSKISNRQYVKFSVLVITPLTIIHILVAKYGYMLISGS